MYVHKLLGMDLPLIQAPMAGVQGAALAAAVCEVRALGSVPTALLTPKALRTELAALKAQTSRAFNVNFFCHSPSAVDEAREARWRASLQPYYTEFGIEAGQIPTGAGRAPFDDVSADVIAAVRPAVVSFHFGLPSPELLARARAGGARIIASATTIAEARWLERYGVDAIIAQGLEAGGHRGHFLSDDLSMQSGTFALLPAIVRAVNVPVIAAGGIADRQGVDAAFALGAAGVQVGTAYLLCPEATTSPIHRAALRSAAAEHTALTNLFTGRPSRGIVNRLMRERGPMSEFAPGFPLAAAAVGPLRTRAEARGSADFSPLWCGQNASGCEEIPAAELTRKLLALE